MSTDTDALKGAILSDVDAYAAAVSADAVAAQKASDAAALTGLQDEFDAYKASHPDQPAPPPPTPLAASTLFGFNIMAGGTQYLPAGETRAQINARLVKDYGPFKAGKTFPNKVISDVSQSAWPGYPSVTDCTLCLGWTWGQVATGSQDAAITSLMKSVPAGSYARLCVNEVDYKFAGGSAAQKSYAADMAHLKALRNKLGLADTVGIFHCFGEWNLEQGYDYSWVNASNCDGIIWDCYENDAATDADGSKKFGGIVAKNAELGVTRWGIGEHGDRRPGSGSGAWADDSHRAAAITARMSTLVALDSPPEVVCWFDVVGSSGDHRILTPPNGNDTASQAAYKAFVTSS